MGDRRARLRPSALPARWRITGWIMLVTLLLLLVVVATARTLLLRDVEVRANADVVQEVEEFRAFAATGVDPTTASPFASVTRMLEVYLLRQSPSQGELLFASVDGVVLDIEGRTGVGDGTVDFTSDAALVASLVNAPEAAGVAATPYGPMRWGRVAVGTQNGQQGQLVVAVFTRGERALVDATIATVATVGTIGLALTSGAAYLVAGRILAPVRGVRKVAEEIGETDLSARVPVEGHDDIADLAATFNDMLDRLENAYVTQRRFVDDAGHELRTPITVVRGHLELISDDPVERAETFRLVDEELARMGRIVSDLLMLAKAQQPDFVVPRSTDVASLILDIESKMQSLGDRRWLLMEVAEGSAPLDAQRVTQAMLQLAANAVQHTQPGSPIKLGAKFFDSGAARRLAIWVTDTGPGVTPDDAAMIFERFQRGGASDRTTTVERMGAGLGLAIVRAIADGHDGSAWVRSVYGEGATFGLTIPTPESEDR